MRSGDFTAGFSKLSLGLKTLQLHWDQTKARWTDPVSLAFEESQLVPLEDQVRSTLRELHRMSATLSQAYRDCADREWL